MWNLSKRPSLRKETLVYKTGPGVRDYCNPQGTENLISKRTASFSRAIGSAGHVFLLSFLLLQVACFAMKLKKWTELVAFPNPKSFLSLFYYIS
jgi:hypothetical protein